MSEKSEGGRLSLSTWILMALGAGIGSGIFFGERTAFLEPLADAFIRLLQMAVLPYIITSLVASLGSLTRRQAGFVARQGGLILGLLWAVAFAVVLSFPLAFPDWKAASFFSTTLVEPPKSFDFVKLFIPANLFESAAGNVVPAVVLFSIAVGFGLMTVPRRNVLIENLNVISAALTQITNFAVSLTPIGVFAIAASTAGTISVEEFGRLQVYLLTYVALSLLMTLWILPGLVAVLTPLSYGEVVRASREAVLTAFSTGSLLVVLPLLAERSKELLQKIKIDKGDAEPVVDVLVPVSFNFPTVGKLLTLGFLLFAGWFSGAEVAFSEYPGFIVSGLLTFFGSVYLAIPFLLDQLRIPADMLQLFLAVSFLNFRFATLVSTMHTLVLTLLATCAVVGVMTVRWAQLARYLAVSLAAVMLVLGGIRLLFETTGGGYHGYELVTERELSREFPPAVVHTSSPPARFPAAPGRSRLDEIRERGVIRVGYYANNLPMTYLNARQRLVGFDVEMAHRLASDLAVDLEFVPRDVSRPWEQLGSGEVDLFITLAVTPDRTEWLSFSKPYMKMTLSFLVEDHLRQEFGSRKSVKALDSPVIAVPGNKYYLERLSEYLPRAKVVLIQDLKEFFEAKPGTFDAMLYPAEMGAAWTLLYPQFSVAIPHPDVVQMSLAYGLPRGDPDFLAFVNTWIDFQTTAGQVDRLRRYWILGRQEEDTSPRWSVIRDVLHWVE